MPIKILTKGADLHKGTGGDDQISALDGDDRVSGRGGDDRIEGGAGDDVLFGDEGTGMDAATVGTPLLLDYRNLEAESHAGRNAEVGDWAIYRDVAELADGTSVWGRLVLTGKSDARMKVDLSAEGHGREILLNGKGQGDSADFRLEFFDPETGDPVALSSIATVNDIDRSGNGDQEAVSLDKGSFAAFATSEDTSLDVTRDGGTIRAGGTEQNKPSEEDGWFSARFEDRTHIEFSLQSRDSDSGFTLSGDLIRGADFVDIEAGDDTLDGGAGNDELDGGAGQDSLLGGEGDDRVRGGAGDDTLQGGIGRDTVLGGSGRDSLSGGAGDDSLDGGAGEDSIAASEGRDTLLGGAGADTLSGGAGADSLDGGEGDDCLIGGSGGDTLLGGAGDDLIVTGDDGAGPGDSASDANRALGGAGDDTLIGGAGADALQGEGGDDSLVGGSGADSLRGADGADTMAGADGDDWLEGGAGGDVLLGGAGNDTLRGGDGLNTIDAGGGDDLVEGQGGWSRADLGAGNDTFTGAGAVAGGAGDDRIDFSSGGRLDPSDYNVATGGAGDDTLIGSDNNEFIRLSDGRDTVSGGGDHSGDRADPSRGDWLSAEDLAGGVRIDIGAGRAEHAGGTTLFEGIEHAAGSGEADALVGDAGANSLVGAGGDDTLAGGQGDDTLSGNAGGDTFRLVAGGGADTVTDFVLPSLKGDGTYLATDVLDVSALRTPEGEPVTTDDVTVSDTAGDGFGHAVLVFPSGERVILQGIAPDQLSDPALLEAMGLPAPGPDGIVHGTEGDDVIGEGFVDPQGDGIDLLDRVADTLDGALSSLSPWRPLPPDALPSAALPLDPAAIADLAADIVHAGAGHDLIEAGDGDDTVLGGEGDDTLIGGAGDDLIEGGLGNDLLRTGLGDDTLLGGGGDDTLTNSAGDDSLVGGTGDDSIVATRGDDTLEGGEGSDTLFGGADDDFLSGGEGDDKLDGGAGADMLEGDAGADTLVGADGDDTLRGGADGDDLLAGAGNDSLDGGDGDDTLEGGDGDDLLIGGAGDDVMYTGLGDDTLHGGAGDDTLRNSAGDDSLVGGTGDDSIVATEGADTLEGGEGDDTLIGGADDDSLSGGDGDDDLSGDGGRDSLQGGEGDDTLAGGAGDDTLDGDRGDDALSGGAGADRLFGNGGADTIGGGAGADTAHGGAGDDSLSGGAGEDRLLGESGADTLSGGAGDDTLTGGAGDDTFEQTAGSGADIVTDFDLGDDDGDGFTNDQFDVSDLGGGSGPGGAVTAWDVRVTDDGAGNAMLIFPEGESVVLQGVAPAQMSSAPQLHATGIPCFTPGTRLLTGAGYIPVEHLRPGDRVQTADDGLQPILWVGRRALGALDLRRAPHLAPVRIAPGTLGNAAPLIVSPQHRFRIAGRALREVTGQSEAFVKARLLAGRAGAEVLRAARGVTYIHILTERHQVLMADGVWTESLHPGPFAMSGLDRAARAELFALFPRLRVILRLPPAAARAALPALYSPLARPDLRRRALEALAPRLFAGP